MATRYTYRIETDEQTHAAMDALVDSCWIESRANIATVVANMMRAADARQTRRAPNGAMVGPEAIRETARFIRELFLS